MDKRRFLPRGETHPSSPIVEMRLGERIWQELYSGDGIWWSRLQGVHEQLLATYGIPFPDCELRLDTQLPANVYQFQIAGGRVESGLLYPTRWFVAGDAEVVSLLMGEEAVEPVYGLEGRWIPDTRAEAAEQLGCHLLTADALWAGHLSDRIERNLDRCLHPTWVNGHLRTQGLKAGPGLTQQLAWLLEERVSVRALERIVEAYRGSSGPPSTRLRKIRQALGAWVLAPWTGVHERLAAITFSETTSRRLRRELLGSEAADGWFIQLVLQQIYAELGEALTQYGEVALLIAGDLRRPLFELLPFELRRTPVLAYEEVPADLECVTAGVVGSQVHPAPVHWPCAHW